MHKQECTSYYIYLHLTNFSCFHSYASCIAHALKYHECDTEPVYDWQQHKLRIRRADVCSHGDEPGDVCDDCVAALQPTERRVKYDCSRHEFVITVREARINMCCFHDSTFSMKVNRRPQKYDYALYMY